MRIGSTAVGVLVSSVALLALAAPGSAQQGRTIAVTGDAELRVPPDEVVLSLGAETFDADLERAKADNDRRVEAILAAAREHGIAPEHLKTDYVALRPDYDDRTLMGYWVRKTVVVRLSDLSRFESLLSATLEAGANTIHGIDLRTTELRAHRDRARAVALEAAREKAEAMAAVLGQEVGEPVDIQELSSGWWSPYASWWGAGRGGGMAQNVVQSGGAAAGLEGPMVPGQLAVTARVRVVFELR